MDGFFDKYGRVIIIAVAICFVLLCLTPMRNVVGSSVNEFAGGFANKVGESLGKVKMPDAGVVQSGSILKIEGNEYIVLEQRENNQALVMTIDSIGNKMFQSQGRADGQYRNTYEGSEIDKYLENEWYNGLSSKMKAAIQSTNIKQVAYAKWDDPDSKQETGHNGQVYNTINRHTFLPSVSEIEKTVDLKNPYKVKAFLNGVSIWTRDSYQDLDFAVEFLRTGTGSLNIVNVYSTYANKTIGVRPAFVIDLSRVDYKVEGTTNYK